VAELLAAYDHAARLRADPLRTALAALPAAAGSMLNFPARAPGQVSTVLTPRETEVLALLARPDQPTDRRHAVHQQDDGQGAREQQPGQALRERAHGT
jgi:hypothetical protein